MPNAPGGIAAKPARLADDKGTTTPRWERSDSVSLKRLVDAGQALSDELGLGLQRREIRRLVRDFLAAHDGIAPESELGFYEILARAADPGKLPPGFDASEWSAARLRNDLTIARPEPVAHNIKNDWPVSTSP